MSGQEDGYIERHICPDCAITFHLMLRGKPVRLIGPASLVGDIEHELEKLKPRVTHDMVESLERRKDLLGWIQNKDLLTFLMRCPELKQWLPPTIDRSIRALADPAVENPPFLKRWTVDGFPSGRYIINGDHPDLQLKGR